MTPKLRMSVINLPVVDIEQMQVKNLDQAQLAQLQDSWSRLKGCRDGQSQMELPTINNFTFLKFSCQRHRGEQVYQNLQLILYNASHSLAVSFEIASSAPEELTLQLTQVIESLQWTQPVD